MSHDLRALAAAATPGPWSCNEPHPRYITTTGEIEIDEADWGQPDDCHLMQLTTVADSRAWRYADVRYVAAVSPDVVVGLLDEIDRLQDELDLEKGVISFIAADRPGFVDAVRTLLNAPVVWDPNYTPAADTGPKEG